MTKRDLMRLGKLVDQEQQKALASQDSLHTIRARLLAPPRNKRLTKTLRWMIPSAALLSAAAVAGLVVWSSSQTGSGSAAPITFEIDDGRKNVARTWIVAPKSCPKLIDFSDGSAIVLQPTATLRVDRVDSRGAELRIRKGSAVIRVKPRPQRKKRWVVRAGPYRVRVVGTKFRVSWDPARKHFDLDLERGKVVVDGPHVRQHTMIAGQHLSVSVDQPPKIASKPQLSKPKDQRHVDPPTLATSSTADARSPATIASKPVAQQRKPVAPTTSSDATQPTSRKLQPRKSQTITVSKKASANNQPPAKAGAKQPTAAMLDQPMPSPDASPASAAGAAGDKQRLQPAWKKAASQARNGKELFTLAGKLRREGKLEASKDVYLMLRSRFAGSRAAARAAFEIGRIAIHLKKPRNAILWFERYLSERPKGTLALVAQGRRIEALVKAGQIRRARKLAAQYLAKHPRGPHAGLARKLSSTSAPKKGSRTGSKKETK
jgi:hypothetical protein